MRGIKLEVIVGIVGELKDQHEQAANEPRVVMFCGDLACNRSVTLLADGSQLRINGPLTAVQKGLPGVELDEIPCNVHGGEPFPSQEGIERALKLRDGMHLCWPLADEIG